jgi:hypothetical protein
VASTALRLPEDLPVVSHFNWSPGSAEPRLPVKCLGFDLRALALDLFAAFAAYAEGGRLPERVEAQPFFEEELRTGVERELFK